MAGWLAVPQIWLAGPQAWLSGPQAWLAGWLAGWLVGWAILRMENIPILQDSVPYPGRCQMTVGKNFLGDMMISLWENGVTNNGEYLKNIVMFWLFSDNLGPPKDPRGSPMVPNG